MYSNTIDFFDSLPKYVINKKAIDKSDPVWAVYRTVSLNNITYSITLQPAVIKDRRTGKQKQLFPGVREELVEDALRKIATRRMPVKLSREGFSGTAVLFTLYELRRELKDLGHSYSIVQLREAISVLTRSQLIIETDAGETITEGSPFPFSWTSPGGKALKGKKRPDITAFVMLNPLVTKGIYEGEYRQYNYQLCMAYSRHMSRWLHKRLLQRFRQAGLMQAYTIRLSKLEEMSGTGPYGRVSEARRAVVRALEEMIEKDVVERYEEEVIFDERRANRVLDVKFHIYPSSRFVQEVKRANAIQRGLKEKISGVIRYTPQKCSEFTRVAKQLGPVR